MACCGFRRDNGAKETKYTLHHRRNCWPESLVSDNISFMLIFANRNLHARNTLVQLLALYTEPESHNAQRYKQTGGRTDGRQDHSRSYSVCISTIG